MYFTANDINYARKQQAVLLSWCGVLVTLCHVPAKTFSLQRPPRRGLLRLSARSWLKHLQPEPLEIVQCFFRFHTYTLYVVLIIHRADQKHHIPAPPKARREAFRALTERVAIEIYWQVNLGILELVKFSSWATHVVQSLRRMNPFGL